jgi:hypothetical protein
MGEPLKNNEIGRSIRPVGAFRVFRNCTLPRQLVAFQKRFRFPELQLPLAEIRPEFDASNASMLALRLCSDIPKGAIPGFPRETKRQPAAAKVAVS